MAEELNVTNEVVDDQTVEVPETKPESKTFTQDELDKIVADRMAREDARNSKSLRTMTT
jgi:hypothetical protein